MNVCSYLCVISEVNIFSFKVVKCEYAYLIHVVIVV